ncbi:MAG: YraN family protein [Clostridioides sp.]|jgi:putative endonuclease|nr:YraN family protein [Clostridioides sp.]
MEFADKNQNKASKIDNKKENKELNTNKNQNKISNKDNKKENKELNTNENQNNRLNTAKKGNKLLKKHNKQKWKEENRNKGAFGEEVACEYLKKKGAQIIERNYTNHVAEIDIIAKLDENLVFVEVKSRMNLRYGYPSESVDFRKKKKIVNLAQYYIYKNECFDVPIRFDVVEVFLNEGKLRHIINAF